MKNTKIKLAGILLGAALASTGAYAAGSSCGAGKCGGETKKMEKKSGSCGAGKCSGETKKMDKMDKGGKCGADIMKKKKMNGTCAAGKCSGETKKK